MSPERRILVAIDFSAGSDEALTQAITLAGQMHADLELVYVLEAGVDVFVAGLTAFDSEQVDPRAGIERELANRAARARERGIACRTLVLQGNPSIEVTRRSREIGADLVVVGTHGRTGLSHVLLGSVAEKIVRRSICPVLTVPFSKKAA
jgi:nucleotide-binding universal stress UspA family protein